MYMLFTGSEVRTEKYFPEVSEAARDRRSRDASETEGNIFQYGPTLTVSNLFFLPSLN